MTATSVLRDLWRRDVGGPRLIRTRTAIVGALGGIIALVVGALLTVAAVRHALVQDVGDEVTTTLDELEADITDGLIPVLRFDRQDSTVAQIVADGNVLAASSELVGLPPLTSAVPPPDRDVRKSLSSFRPWTTHPVLVSTRLVDSEDFGPVVLVAAASMQTMQRATRAVLQVALGVGAILLIGVQLVIWLVVRRALRPVEQMSMALASIVDGPDLSRRVPMPRYDDEIARLARSTNRMLGELERAYERQQRFAGDVAHELRSPLSAMRTQLEVALRQPGAGWQAHVRDALTDEIRLEELVDNLLLLARLDERVAATPPAPVDLLAVAESVVARMAPSRARIVIDDRGPALVTGNEVQLEIVVRNLVSNATRYAASVIRVLVGPAGTGTVEVRVADDGPGIPEADRERVFERFARLDPSRTRVPGAGGYGLGLSIAREVVTRHGGTIEVAGGGPGATFVVRLPALDDDAQPSLDDEGDDEPESTPAAAATLSV